MISVTFGELLSAHVAVFLDAYGVLVDARGALPGAVEVVRHLDERGVRWAVVTNDASRLPETMERRFASFGLGVPCERIVSSGDLVAGALAARGLAGARCVVLGPEDAREIVRRAGGTIVAPSVDAPADAVIACDESGFDFLETIDLTISMLFVSLARGDAPALLLPNPDLLYPKGERTFGVAAAGIALLVEAALAHRFPGDPRARFERLGKPFAPIFDAACRRLGVTSKKDAVMIGDQLHTDVAGANAFGIASALLGSGIARREDAEKAEIRPTYWLRSLAI